jgi:hypothetical protein
MAFSIPDRDTGSLVLSNHESFASILLEADSKICKLHPDTLDRFSPNSIPVGVPQNETSRLSQQRRSEGFKICMVGV